MVDLSFSVDDIVRDEPSPAALARRAEAAAALVADKARQAVKDQALRVENKSRAAIGRLPLVPMPRGLMGVREFGTRAPAMLAHSEWYQRERPDLALTGRDYSARLTETGWPWYHQTTGEARRPKLFGTLGGKIGALEHGPASAADVAQWDDAFLWGSWRGETTATLYCGYKGLWALDSDWSRPEWAEAMLRIAGETMGVSPFRRGRHNSLRCAMLYRMPEGVPLPRNRRIKLLTGEVDEAGKPGTEDLEVKGKGQSITLLGMHSSGAPYAWHDRIPGFDGASPDDVPVVTEEQADAFLAALESHFADALVAPTRASSMPRGGYELAADEGVAKLRTTARAYLDAMGSRWDVVDGRVTKGRGEWGYHHLITIIRTNAAALRAVVEAENGGEDAARKAVLARFIADLPRLVDGDGKHSLDRMVEDARQGQLDRAWGHTWPRVRDRAPEIRRGADGVDVLIEDALPTSSVDVAASGDEDLAGLLSPTASRTIRGITLTAPDPEVAARRACPMDRRPIEAMVAATVDAALDGFFEDAARGGKGLTILKAPTGSGKTSRMLAKLRALKEAGTLGGPVLVCMQNYGLISESTDRVEAANAERAALAEATAEARAMGLRAMVYEGKGRLCVRPEMSILQSRGIGTGNLCETVTPARGHREREVKWCRHFETCPAITQKSRVKDSNVVFLPSAYLTAKLPRELKQSVRAIVIDEACHDQLIGEVHVSLPTLERGRPMAKLKREERENGLDPFYLARDREELAAIVRDAVLLDEPIPEYVKGRTAADGRPARDLVAVARRLVSDAMRPVGIHPLMTEDGAKLAIGPSPDLWREWHLWDVVQDRLDAFDKGAARGDHDVRLQVLDIAADERGRRAVGEETRIRVAFRRTPNWNGIPVLLLDASADEAVTGKLWPGRAVTVVQVEVRDARPHMRVMWCPESTYADSGLLPYRSGTGIAAAGAATALAGVRTLLEGLCGYYGQGQVLAASTLGVELALTTAWPGPRNLSTVHHGALVGLDFARHYPALVCVGRQEPSIRAMDSRAAALSYDDLVPELSHDRLGTGLTEDGREVRYPVETRTVPMADGSEATYGVPTHPGLWGGRMQWLSREEGVAQAIGRVRPVYKDGSEVAPLVVILGRALPQGIIVDAISTVADLVSRTQAYRQIAADGGFAPILRPGPGLAGEQDSLGWSRVLNGMLGGRLAALDRVAYRSSEGEGRTGYALGCAPDLHAAVAKWEAAQDRGAPTDVRVIQRGRDLPAMSPRPADVKLEAIVGTCEQRAEARKAAREAAEAYLAAIRPKLVAASGRASDVLTPEAALVAVTVTARATKDAPAFARDVAAGSAPVPEVAAPAPVPPGDATVAMIDALFQGAMVVSVRTLGPDDEAD